MRGFGFRVRMGGQGGGFRRARSRRGARAISDRRCPNAARLAIVAREIRDGALTRVRAGGARRGGARGVSRVGASGRRGVRSAAHLVQDRPLRVRVRRGVEARDEREVGVRDEARGVQRVPRHASGEYLVDVVRRRDHRERTKRERRSGGRAPKDCSGRRERGRRASLAGGCREARARRNRHTRVVQYDQATIQERGRVWGRASVDPGDGVPAFFFVVWANSLGGPTRSDLSVPSELVRPRRDLTSCRGYLARGERRARIAPGARFASAPSARGSLWDARADSDGVASGETGQVPRAAIHRARMRARSG
jgi:hypothetical protein